jgi:hypothetical protein
VREDTKAAAGVTARTAVHGGQLYVEGKAFEIAFGTGGIVVRGIARESKVLFRVRGSRALDYVPSKYRARVASAFRGEVVAEAYKEDIIVYRHWGGKSKEIGSPWFSLKPYARPGNARRYLALPEGNTAEHLTAFKIPAGTPILRGKVASQVGQVGFSTKAVGHGIQIYVPDPSVVVPIR